MVQQPPPARDIRRSAVLERIRLTFGHVGGHGTMGRSWLLPVVTAALLVAGCGEKPSDKPADKPSKAEPVGHETELLKLTLTPQAVQRLGITTVAVGTGAAAKMRAASGEIVAPTGAGSVPVRSVTDLAEMSAAQTRAEGDIARARAEVELAKLNYARAERLMGLQAGSARARDEAKAVLGTAEAALAAAQKQRALLGPSVSAIGNVSGAWVRVPVFGSDVPRLVQGAAIKVEPLGGGGPVRLARPVRAVPSSDAAAGTVDLYYAVANSDHVFRVGQRVAVELPMRGATQGLSVPASAVIRDIYGGEWVYAQVGDNAYERRRIEVAASNGGTLLVARGLASGDTIVTAGAAELYGTEFGAK